MKQRMLYKALKKAHTNPLRKKSLKQLLQTKKICWAAMWLKSSPFRNRNRKLHRNRKLYRNRKHRNPILRLHLPLVTSALTIASERLEALHPMRYRRLSDVEFSRKLANLTMKIARELVTEAEKANITFSQE